MLRALALSALFLLAGSSSVAPASARLQAEATSEFDVQGLELLAARFGAPYPGYENWQPPLTPFNLGVGSEGGTPLFQPMGMGGGGVGGYGFASASLGGAAAAAALLPNYAATGMGLAAWGAGGSKKGQSQFAAPIEAAPIVVPQIIEQPILRKNYVQQPMVQQQFITQPIVETRQVAQPIVRRIITQPVIKPTVYESTIVQPTLKTETIVQPHLIQQTVVTPQVQNVAMENAPIQEAPAMQKATPVVQPTVNKKGGSMSYGGLGMLGF